MVRSFFTLSPRGNYVAGTRLITQLWCPSDASRRIRAIHPASQTAVTQFITASRFFTARCARPETGRRRRLLVVAPARECPFSFSNSRTVNSPPFPAPLATPCRSRAACGGQLTAHVFPHVPPVPNHHRVATPRHAPRAGGFSTSCLPQLHGNQLLVSSRPPASCRLALYNTGSAPAMISIDRTATAVGGVLSQGH